GAGLYHEQGDAAGMITPGGVAGLNALPHGLPMLAGAGQGAGSRRPARHKALVRPLVGIEGPGRGGIACAAKTGTLAEGELTLALLADLDREMPWPPMNDAPETGSAGDQQTESPVSWSPVLPVSLSAFLEDDFSDLLLSAALASPCPVAVSPLEGMVS